MHKSYEIFFFFKYLVTREEIVVLIAKNAQKVFADKCTLIALPVLFKVVPRTR